jgi:hypothetical protein
VTGTGSGEDPPRIQRRGVAAGTVRVCVAASFCRRAKYGRDTPFPFMRLPPSRTFPSDCKATL